jgi:hypothetical protein
VARPTRTTPWTVNDIVTDVKMYRECFVRNAAVKLNRSGTRFQPFPVPAGVS